MSDMKEKAAEGFAPVIEWKAGGVPAGALELWKESLSGLMADGSVGMTADGAAGVTDEGLFMEAMAGLSAALADRAGGHVFVETGISFAGSDGLLPESGTRGETYIVGMLGCEPLRVWIGENPFSAVRRAIEKACGGFAARQLEAASGGKKK